MAMPSGTMAQQAPALTAARCSSRPTGTLFAADASMTRGSKVRLLGGAILSLGEVAVDQLGGTFNSGVWTYVP
jgi:hypothetical protein